MQKLNAGLGTFFAGQVLNFINFDRSNHTAEQAYTLAFVQGPCNHLVNDTSYYNFFFLFTVSKKASTNLERDWIGSISAYQNTW